MIESSDPENTHTFDAPGLRVYCVDGAEGPLALYDTVNDEAWVGSECPCDLSEWR